MDNADIFGALGLEQNKQPGEKTSGTAAADTTTAAATTTETTTAADTTSTQPTFPEGFAPAIFGEGYTDWNKVKEEVPARLAKMAELEQQLAELRNNPVKDYFSPEIEEINAFARAIGKLDLGAYETLKSVEYDKMEPIDALVFKQVYENPEYRGSEELLKAKIIKDYGLDPESYTPEEIKLNSIRLREDVKKNGAWFSELKGKMTVKSPDPEAARAQQAQQLESWKSEVKNILTGLEKLSLVVPDGDKFKPLTEYVFKEDVRNRYADPMANSAAKSLGVNDESRSIVQAQLRNNMIVENLPYILQHVTDKLRTEIELELDAKYGGAISRSKEPGGGNGAGKPDVLEEAVKKWGAS